MDEIQANQSTHELGWWIEIMTARPLYLYYFGAFATQEEALASQAGFIQDLMQENAQILSINMQFCQPRQVTLTAKDLRSHFHESDKLQSAIFYKMQA